MLGATALAQSSPKAAIQFLRHTQWKELSSDPHMCELPPQYIISAIDFLFFNRFFNKEE